MMNETSQMSKDIRRLTLMLALTGAGISLLLMQGHFSSVGIGILIGALTGIIGFNRIVKMSGNIELYGDATKKGYGDYVKRYAIYTIIFALSAYKGVHIVALLIGMLCHKAAIILYVFIHRKEDD